MATILVGHVTKDGAVAGPARARAPRRLRAPVRGRPLPRAPRAAGGQEPVRLDERARRLRDDRRGSRRRARPVRAVRAHARRARSARPSRARSRARGRCCSRSRRSWRRPTSRCRAGSAPASTQAAGDDRGRPVAPRGRAARLGGRVRQRRRRRADRRARRRPRGRARDRVGSPECGRSARAGPRSARSASPGGCGPAAQAERRLEECAKLGLRAALVRPARRAVADFASRSGDARGRRSGRTRCRTSRSRRDRATTIRGVEATRAARRIARVAPGTELRQGIDDIIRSHEGADRDRRPRRALVPLLRRHPPRPAVHAAAPLRAGEDGRGDHRQRGLHEARLRERPADARPDDPVERDGHAAPHRRARREADEGARRSRSRSSARP